MTLPISLISLPDDLLTLILTHLTVRPEHPSFPATPTLLSAAAAHPLLATIAARVLHSPTGSSSTLDLLHPHSHSSSIPAPVSNTLSTAPPTLLCALLPTNLHTVRLPPLPPVALATTLAALHTCSPNLESLSCRDVHDVPVLALALRNSLLGVRCLAIDSPAEATLGALAASEPAAPLLQRLELTRVAIERVRDVAAVVERRAWPRSDVAERRSGERDPALLVELSVLVDVDGVSTRHAPSPVVVETARAALLSTLCCHATSVVGHVAAHVHPCRAGMRPDASRWDFRNEIFEYSQLPRGTLCNPRTSGQTGVPLPVQISAAREAEVALRFAYGTDPRAPERRRSCVRLSGLAALAAALGGDVAAGVLARDGAAGVWVEPGLNMCAGCGDGALLWRALERGGAGLRAVRVGNENGDHHLSYSLELETEVAFTTLQVVAAIMRRAVGVDALEVPLRFLVSVLSGVERGVGLLSGLEGLHYLVVDLGCPNLERGWWYWADRVLREVEELLEAVSELWRNLEVIAFTGGSKGCGCVAEMCNQVENEGPSKTIAREVERLQSRYSHIYFKSLF